MRPAAAAAAAASSVGRRVDDLAGRSLTIISSGQVVFWEEKTVPVPISINSLHVRHLVDQHSAPCMKRRES